MTPEGRAEQIDAAFWQLPLGTSQETASDFLVEEITKAIAQAVEQAERALADARSYIEDFKLSIARVSDENITLRATLALCQMDRTKYAERVADLETTLARVEEQRDFFDGQNASAMETVGKLADDVERLTAERDGLREDNQRLRNVLIADGLDPDMPIPPGLKLERDRFLEERDGLRAALEKATERHHGLCESHPGEHPLHTFADCPAYECVEARAALERPANNDPTGGV